MSKLLDMILEDTDSWEESYGTDDIFFNEEYQVHVPYWFSYMPKQMQISYAAALKVTRDFEPSDYLRYKEEE